MKMKTASLLTALAMTAGSASATVLITDTFDGRTLTSDWGTVDNGLVGGESGTISASYVLDDQAGVNVDGGAAMFTNSRVVLDYNLATDADVIAGGGFVVEFTVSPGDGDDGGGVNTGTGRESAGVAIVDSTSNPPFGGAGAITNAGNTVIRYAALPRNSGSVGTLLRDATGTRVLTAGGNPNAGFNEDVFDQTTFDRYVSEGTPTPFVNALSYDVRIEVSTNSFAAGELATVSTTVNGVTLSDETISWGEDNSAYVSAIAFNGPHGYDDLKVTALPEPASIALLGLGGLAMLRRRA